jgi:hypothetical protein
VITVEGQAIEGCPWSLVPGETLDMIQAEDEYSVGHTPVTLGHASWLPALFVDGVRAVRAARNEARGKKK